MSRTSRRGTARQGLAHQGVLIACAAATLIALSKGVAAQKPEQPAATAPVAAQPASAPSKTGPAIQQPSPAVPKPAPAVAPIAASQQRWSVFGLSVQDVTNILLACFTAFTSVTGFLQWKATRGTLSIVQRQTAALEAVTKSETAYRISAAHREIFIAFFGNPLALQILQDDVLEGESRSDGSLAQSFSPSHQYLRAQMGSLLINHVADVFQSFQRHHLETADWVGMQNDIKDLFGWRFVRERWFTIKEYYSPEFRDFIDRVTRTRTGTP